MSEQMPREIWAFKNRKGETVFAADKRLDNREGATKYHHDDVVQAYKQEIKEQKKHHKEYRKNIVNVVEKAQEIAREKDKRIAELEDVLTKLHNICLEHPDVTEEGVTWNLGEAYAESGTCEEVMKTLEQKGGE